MRVLAVPLAAATLLGAVVVGRQTPATPPPTGSTPERLAACRGASKEMSRAVADLHAAQRNVGVAVVVMLADSIVFSSFLGSADLEHRVPVAADTRFGIASITKAFTGLAALKLSAAGRLDLDAPIQRYVPDFPEKPGGVITPRLLLTHLAGIRHPGSAERTPQLFATHFDDINEVLRLFRNDTLLAKPGARYVYSSYGYNLLAAAIQSAAGKRFQSYVEDAIITPLGLRATQFDDVRRVVPGRARRYAYFDPLTYQASTVLVRVPDWDYSFNSGGGNMLSTAPDLARLGAALTRPGFLSAQVLDRLYVRQAPPGMASPWSFGFFSSADTARRKQLNITGSNPGLQAGLYVYPEARLSVAVLANAWGVGSNSGDMVIALPQRLAALCMRW